MEGILGRCQEYCSSAHKRAMLLEDGEMLSGLALMTDAESTTSTAALGILLSLAESLENGKEGQLRSILRPALQSLMQRKDLSPQQSSLLAALTSRLHISELGKEAPLRSLQTSTDGGNVGAGPAKLRKLHAPRPFIAAQRCKVLLFRFREPFNTELRNRLEPLMAAVKGVVSIYFDMETRELTLRVRPTFIVDDLIQALRPISSAFVMDQLITGSGGEKNVQPFIIPSEETEVGDDDKENRDPNDGPDYLNESYDASPKAGDKALARTGQPSQGSKGSGWFTGVTSFISENLFW